MVLKINRNAIICFLLITIIFTGGCVNIDVEQKLKRNGHYDMALTISTSQEYKMILSTLKEGFVVNDSVKDKFIYSETDTSITYSFKDLDPAKDKVLFKPIEEKDDDENDMFGQTSEGPDSSFLDPKNYEFTKEFKFPYYEYTYKIKVSPEPKEDKKKIEILTTEEYILDNANLLDMDTKNQIMQNINNIYKDDLIEVIIATEEEMDSMDFFSYKYDLTGDFDFKNKNGKYIIIFASKNDRSVCKVESNIYTDSEISSIIRTISSDFSKNCKDDYNSQILDVTTQLDAFFKEHKFESTSDLQMEDALGDLFKIGYTVEVFGEIIDTNGLEMEDNKVKFDISLTNEEEYTVTFRDFFLAAILGSYYWVYLCIIALLIIGILIKIRKQ